jgi:hypothetical protein
MCCTADNCIVDCYARAQSTPFKNLKFMPCSSTAVNAGDVSFVAVLAQKLPILNIQCSIPASKAKR